MGWPYDVEPNRLLEVFFRCRGQVPVVSGFGRILAVFRGGVSRHTYNDEPAVRFRLRCATVSGAAGAIGAVVARFVHTEEVTGSNPVSPTLLSSIPTVVSLRGGRSSFPGPAPAGRETRARRAVHRGYDRAVPTTRLAAVVFLSKKSAASCPRSTSPS